MMRANASAVIAHHDEKCVKQRCQINSGGGLYEFQVTIVGREAQVVNDLRTSHHALGNQTAVTLPARI